MKVTFATWHNFDFPRLVKNGLPVCRRNSRFYQMSLQPLYKLCCSVECWQCTAHERKAPCYKHYYLHWMWNFPSCSLHYSFDIFAIQVSIFKQVLIFSVLPNRVYNLFHINKRASLLPLCLISFLNYVATYAFWFSYEALRSS